MPDRLTTVKNIIWAVATGICILAVTVGLISAMTRRYDGEKPEMTLDLGSSSMQESSEDDGVIMSTDQSAGIQRGELHQLQPTPDAGDGYQNSLTFLVDSTFVGLRTKQLVEANQVWATSSGSMPIGKLDSSNILFPNDGSEISPQNAAMISKPKILVIGIGTDGLADVDQNTFVAVYDKLIENILSASPDTQIICMGLCSVTEDYNGKDLSVNIMSDGNDWVKLVCRDTGAWYADVAENLGDGSGGLRASYAEANGKSLSGDGLQLVLEYLRTHAAQ